VPLGEAALWLGHSVETLVGFYVGALEGDDTEAKNRIDHVMRPTRAWMLEPPKRSSRALPAKRGKTRSKKGNSSERSKPRDQRV
jgi:hypothetical protein